MQPIVAGPFVSKDARGLIAPRLAAKLVPSVVFIIRSAPPLIVEAKEIPLAVNVCVCGEGVVPKVIALL